MAWQELSLVTRRNFLGGSYIEVVSAGSQTIAETVMEIVAVTLAEPLRKALYEHRVGHSDKWCEECERLWQMMPEGDRVAIA
jgi:hypothetical protein